MVSQCLTSGQGYGWGNSDPVDTWLKPAYWTNHLGKRNSSHLSPQSPLCLPVFKLLQQRGFIWLPLCWDSYSRHHALCGYTVVNLREWQKLVVKVGCWRFEHCVPEPKQPAEESLAHSPSRAVEQRVHGNVRLPLLLLWRCSVWCGKNTYYVKNCRCVK